jgi:glutamyl-tRNA synthetase
MADNKLLADLLLPEVTLQPEDMFSRYPKRTLDESAKVTRFAPSPTGMLHVGGLYAALVSERLAHQSKGICYLRIEDTDRKREVDGSIQGIIKALDYFGIHFDEGLGVSVGEAGNYGPYKQSKRADIYQVFVKHLLVKGLAYPCFCSAEELAELRKQQKEQSAIQGYYGEWAKHRNITFQQAKEEMEKGKSYVIRLKSPGSPNNKVRFTDLIKGYIEMPENNQDIVILKTDGFPTYHFAHAVDDYLMGTTHVLRADEWLSSVPVHLQLFDVLGFKRLSYGHISPIMKMDGTSKRKFSKRKDLDGLAEFYIRQGYPGQAVIEYFMSLINSNYEDWSINNPKAPFTKFTVEIEKMSTSGALLDIDKLNDISKDVISRLSAEQLYDQAYIWADKYDPDLSELMGKYKEYFIKILSIGRIGSKPRKDIIVWSDIKPVFSYFFDELYNTSINEGYALPPTVPADIAKAIVHSYAKVFNYMDDKDTWFDKIKNLAEKFGFARDVKLYKKNPEAYKGNVGDVAMILRVALTNRSATPDLFDIIQVLGMDRTSCRLKKFLENMN